MSYIEGGRISYDGKVLKRTKELKSIVLQSQSVETLTAFKKHRLNKGFANALAFVGGSILGYSVTDSFFQGEIDLGPPVIAAGIVVVAKVFDSASNIALQRVVNNYNQLHSTAIHIEPLLINSQNVTHLGLRVKF